MNETRFLFCSIYAKVSCVAHSSKHEQWDGESPILRPENRQQQKWKGDSKSQTSCVVGVWMEVSNHGNGLAEMSCPRVTAHTGTEILNPASWDRTSNLQWVP